MADEAWPAIAALLRDVRQRLPHVVQRMPDPFLSPDGTLFAHRPPHTIWLSPAGLSVAQELHARFGSQVDLTVGRLPYPPSEIGDGRAVVSSLPQQELPGFDPDRLRLEFDSPLAVVTGYANTVHFLVHNLDPVPLTMIDQNLWAWIEDPMTGRYVGGNPVGQNLGVRFLRCRPAKASG